VVRCPPTPSWSDYNTSPLSGRHFLTFLLCTKHLLPPALIVMHLHASMCLLHCSPLLYPLVRPEYISTVWCIYMHFSTLLRHSALPHSNHNTSPPPGAHCFTSLLCSDLLHPLGPTLTHLHCLVHNVSFLCGTSPSCSDYNVSPLSGASMCTSPLKTPCCPTSYTLLA
jgi:hypothetical protein